MGLSVSLKANVKNLAIPVVADEEGDGGRENQGGAEVPIADGCRMERGGGIGAGEGEHTEGEERRHQGRVSMG